jgi:hypothetical protein
MTDARITQAGLEQFTTSNAPAQVTQVSLEMWASAAGDVPERMLATQVSLEQWVQLVSVPLVQTRVQVMA